MFRRFYPDEYYDSAYHVDYEAFYEKGYRAVLFDVDNTLAEHDAPANARARKLIARLEHLGYGICFVSNNDEPRVKSFSEEVGGTYVYKAGKPSARGYEQAMEKLGTNRTNTLFVGDQIFTDIWGANNAGLYSILVQPIAKHEEIQIILKRIPERWVKHFYLKKHDLRTGDAKNEDHAAPSG